MASSARALLAMYANSTPDCFAIADQSLAPTFAMPMVQILSGSAACAEPQGKTPAPTAAVAAPAVCKNARRLNSN